MAYEKQTWKCGDTITADRMNHIEDGIANVDVGYSCSEERTTLTDESVTTVLEEGNASAEALLTYSSEINAETIKVTFDGVEYTCQYDDGGYGARYNEETNSIDWSTYPFQIFWDGDGSHFTTETAGTYQVKIEAFEETIETTECFNKAIMSFTSPLILNVKEASRELDRTFEEIKYAYLNGRSVLLDPVINIPILGDAVRSKEYKSMISLTMNVSRGGGSIVFGGKTNEVFTASSNDAFPTRVTSES